MKMAYADGYAYNQATTTWSPVAPNLGAWIQPINWPEYKYSSFGFLYPLDAILRAAPWFVECLDGCFLSERGYSLTGTGGWYDPSSGGFIIHLTLTSTQNGDGTYWAQHRETDWLYYKTHQGGKGSRTQTGKLLPLVLLPKDDYIIDADGDIINKK